MLGCNQGAKNTLDRNYLYLAEKRGLLIQADTEGTWVRPLASDGYEVEARQGTWALPALNAKRTYHAKQITFAGGVLGTVPLLLKLKDDPSGLPA